MDIHIDINYDFLDSNGEFMSFAQCVGDATGAYDFDKINNAFGESGLKLDENSISLIKKNKSTNHNLKQINNKKYTKTPQKHPKTSKTGLPTGVLFRDSAPAKPNHAKILPKPPPNVPKTFPEPSKIHP